MGNKKVLVIPPASTFSRYVRARDGMLRLAVYTEGLLPLDTVQMPEKTMLLNEIGVPIYVLEDSKIIDHEANLNIPMTKSQ